MKTVFPEDYVENRGDPEEKCDHKPDCIWVECREQMKARIANPSPSIRNLEMPKIRITLDGVTNDYELVEYSTSYLKVRPIEQRTGEQPV